MPVHDFNDFFHNVINCFDLLAIEENEEKNIFCAYLVVIDNGTKA